MTLESPVVSSRNPPPRMKGPKAGERKFANTERGQPSLGGVRKVNMSEGVADRGKGFLPPEEVSGWSFLTKLLSSISLATSAEMYSPEAIQYCTGRLTEVPKPENDYVLDLSIRTQDEANGCHGERIFTNGLHSPEIRGNHTKDSDGCSVSPTFLPLPANATTRSGKPTRPFKAYPKNFLSLAATDGLIDESNVRYMEFRRQFLSQLHAASGGNGGNKNMKRPVQSASPNQLPSSSGDTRDQAYWERRRKNNEAAKKSRDARRAKEDEIAIRAAFLERENLQLRLELESLKRENLQLRLELESVRREEERLRCLRYANN